jgi:hypothetical protein
MKFVAKILIVAFMLSAGMESFAQIVGVKAGLNLSNMLVKDDDDTYSDDLKMKPGLHLGVTAEIPLDEMISFETGLFFTQKGYKYEQSFMGETVDIKLNLNYLEIPLQGKATFDVGGAQIYGLFGPYVGFGIAGKYKYDDDDEDVEWGSDEDDSDYKRLDFGVNIGAGVQVDAFAFGLSYGLGLANISPYSDGGFREKNRVLGISVAYRFSLGD